MSNVDKPIRVTVLPRTPGVFAPASFMSRRDALAYAWESSTVTKAVMCAPMDFEALRDKFEKEWSVITRH